MIIKQKKLVGLLNEKDILVTSGRAISKDIEKLENDRRKVGLQIQKLKDKILPMVDELTKDKLQEFEEITAVNVHSEDEIEVLVTNVIEDFKKAYIEQKQKPIETK
jgi:hypothetical protein